MVGQPFAVGTPDGAVGTVTMFNPDRSVRFAVRPFGAGYTGGVKVSVGDVTGDGVADVVAVGDADGQSAARVAIINGVNTAISSPAFLPSDYFGQVSVSVGDVTKDGVADIALGTNEGGPHARVFRGGDFAKLADFRAYNGSNFRGRTEVAVGDVTGDGYADLTVAARFGGTTRVTGFSGSSLAPGQTPAPAFASFTLGGDYSTGVYLSAGDLNGDGYADLVFGSYAGAKAGAKVYSGKPLAVSNALSTLASFTPLAASSGSGVRVAVRDVNGDGRADLLTSSGEVVNAYSGTKLGLSLRPPALFTFDPAPDTPGGFTVG